TCRKRRTYVEPPGAYVEAVKKAKPLAYWRLDEFHGPVAGDALGHRAGTYEPGVAFFLEGPSSTAFSGSQTVNRAVQFAGGRMRSSLSDLGSRYSVEMWIWNGLPANARLVTGYF